MPDAAGPSDPAPLPGAGDHRAWPARIAVAALCIALAASAVARYPLAPGLLGLVLALYAALLWRWPQFWLVAVPAALPSFDLAPWTGWIAVEESDLVVLVTVAVLALRRPPRRRDFALSGLGGAALACVVVACAIGVVRGLALPGLAEGSDLPYLRPDNALRVAKGLAIALALLPFLRRTLRERVDGARLLAWGMAAGLALVGAAALWERALFPGILSLDTPYRIVATFSSMNLGGGYIGIYVAMALPFVFALMGRSRPGPALLLAGVAVGALYTLVVSFARTAYASAVIGMLVLVLAASRRERAVRRSFAAPALLLVVPAIIAIAASASGYMQYRIGRLAPDLAGREDLWSQGLALRREGAATALFGMGLGSYARTVFAASPRGDGPGNVALGEEGGKPYLALDAGLPLYIGQRVRVAPDQSYTVSFALRSRNGAVVVAVLCEKAMLYSARCRSLDALSSPDGTWQRFTGTIATGAISRRTRLSLFRRPTELAFFLPLAGSTADIADIRFTSATGRERVANGDFAHGLARWFPTDDVHTVWRIENQYLMTLFEEGALGLAALVLLACAAVAGALRASDPMAPAFAASLAAFLASAVFDCPLEVPRMAALFYLVAFAAIALREKDKGPTVPGRALA
jgi:O-antigen ligase